MENNKILLEEYKRNKGICPNDGNKIFFEYNSKNGIPSFIICTYCLSAYDYNYNDGWTLRLT